MPSRKLLQALATVPAANVIAFTKWVQGLVLSLFLGLAMVPAAQAQPRYTVSAEALQAAVAERFPLRYPVGGLFDLNLQSPRLRLMPEQNRLGAEMPVEAAGEALRRRYPGRFDVDFALRYEASDRTIRATQIRVTALSFPGLRAEVSELLDTYAPLLAAQSLREVVLHQLRPNDLLLPDGLGLQPGSITVTAQGLVISFVPKTP